MINLDTKIHVMMCSNCYELNEIEAVRCRRCGHDAGTPLFRESAERVREVFMRHAAPGRGTS